jgi:hypothetical protein
MTMAWPTIHSHKQEQHLHTPSIISLNKPTSKMTTNIGAQAADAVNEKLVERQKLEQEMYAHHQDLQTLISQRNENEMVKEVRKSWCNCIVRLRILVLSCLIYFLLISLLSLPAAVASIFLYHYTGNNK